MRFHEWGSKLDNRISQDIITEFREAVSRFDVDKMNELHREWHLFCDCTDEESNLFFAKVENGVMLLPEAVRSLVNKEVQYKWVLKDTANLYLVEGTTEAKYMDDAVETSSGMIVDKRLMFVKDIIVFDNATQNVFNWRDEDIAVVYVFEHGFRVDRF